MADRDRGRRPRDVVVVGGGVAGLTVARDLARAGVDVTVLETADRVGGTVAAREVAGLRLDVGAESFATRTRAVADLLGELGLGADIVAPAAHGAWVQLPDDVAPLPREAVLGIPGSPWAPDVRRLIGLRGALRATADRYLPPRTGLSPPTAPADRIVEGDPHQARKNLHDQGKTGEAPTGEVRTGVDVELGGTSLGYLVRVRLGRRVLDRLVAPVVSGVHSAHPDEVDLDAVLPGLRHRLLTRGSLAAAVTGLRASRTGSPGSAVCGLVGGMNRLVSALEQDLRAFGVEIRTDTTVRAINPTTDHWHLTLTPTRTTPTPAASTPAAPSAAAPDHDVEENPHQARGSFHDEQTTCRRLVLAVPGGVIDVLLESAGAPRSPQVGTPAARRADPVRSRSRITTESSPDRAGRAVGAGPTGRTEGGAPDTITVATLVVDAPELDAAPRGTGVLVADDVVGVRARALTHATAKWAWLADAAGRGRHVLRLSYGGRGRRTRHPAPGGQVTQAEVLADAGRLLGISLCAEQVVGFAITRWPTEHSRPDPGHRARVAALEAELVQHHPTVRLTGAWVSGIGLAAVVAHARGTAERLLVEG